ncbi:MAG: phosphatase domain-containing protein [Bdellovibrio sp.]
MRKWTGALAILLLLTTPLAFALPETVIISDIDDTIRKTQVHHTGAVSAHISNVLNPKAFIGMPALYSLLAANGVQFHYISGAPEIISAIPMKFLAATGFPVGPVTLRPSIGETTLDFKVAAIEASMRSRPNADFIFIGDNGEADTKAYARVSQDPEFRDRVKLVFIHKLYDLQTGVALLPGQLSYMTAAELALDFVRAGLLGEQQAEMVLRQVEQGLGHKSKAIRTLVIPEFASYTSQEVIAFHNRRYEQTNPTLRQLVIAISLLKNEFLQPGDGIRDVYFTTRERLCRRVMN